MRKLILLIAAVCLLLTGCGMFSEPENIDVKVDMPLTLEKGEEFQFAVTITNEDKKSHTLDSIDFETEFIEGILIYDVEPEEKEEWEQWGIHSFDFQRDLGAGETIKVAFFAKAVKEGDYGGELDVCIDGAASCISKFTRIVVE